MLWLLTGLIIGGGLIGLVLWLRNKNITVTWYEWLIGSIAVLLLLFAIQNFDSAFFELEPTAGWMMLVFFGLPAIILLAVAWQLVARRHRAD